MSRKDPSAERPVRRRRSDGQRSREAILAEAARLATVEGIEGLSLGRLADAVGMSKSGLFAHFSSKEELQLETIATATDVFAEVVIGPAQEAAPGVERLVAYTDRFLDHVQESVFPGGCFFASVAAELDARPGIVRDRVLAMIESWMGLLEAEIVSAQAAGDLDAEIDPGQLAFELHAFLLLGNTQFVAGGGGDMPLARAHAAIAARVAQAMPARRRRRATTKAA